VFQVTTHVENAGGFGGLAASPPTEAGTSQTLIIGTAGTAGAMGAQAPTRAAINVAPKIGRESREFDAILL
jgi:hypothetical protein